MAEDQKDTPAGEAKAASPLQGSAIPNRDRRREPPTIEAKAEGISAPAKPAGVSSPTSPAPQSSAPQKPAPDKASGPATVSTPASGTADKPAAASSPSVQKHVAANSAVVKAATPITAMLLASVAGAGIALAGGWILLASNYHTRSSVEALLGDVTKRNAQNAALEAAARKQEESLGQQAASLSNAGKRIAALEALAKKQASDLESLRQIPRPVAAPQPQPAPVDLGPIEAGLGDLEKRLALIETALAAPKTELRATDPEVRPPPPAEPPAQVAAQLGIPASLISDFAALSARLKGLESRPLPPPPADLAPLTARLQQIEQRLAPLAEKLGPLEQKLAPLEAALNRNQEALGGQAKNIAASRERADAAALSVVARALADAVNSGAPFASILKTAATLGADKDASGALQKFAETGVPSADSLVAQFSPLGAAILAAADKPDPKASLTEKLTASASRLVRVRPAEDTAEETVPALVTRIGGALRTQKFEDALVLFEKLPAPARASAQGWAASLKNRTQADQAIRTILSGALARLSRQ